MSRRHCGSGRTAGRAPSFGPGKVACRPDRIASDRRTGDRSPDSPFRAASFDWDTRDIRRRDRCISSGAAFPAAIGVPPGSDMSSGSNWTDASSLSTYCACSTPLPLADRRGDVNDGPPAGRLQPRSPTMRIERLGRQLQLRRQQGWTCVVAAPRPPDRRTAPGRFPAPVPRIAESFLSDRSVQTAAPIGLVRIFDQVGQGSASRVSLLR